VAVRCRGPRPRPSRVRTNADSAGRNFGRDQFCNRDSANTGATGGSFNSSRFGNHPHVDGRTNRDFDSKRFSSRSSANACAVSPKFRYYRFGNRRCANGDAADRDSCRDRFCNRADANPGTASRDVCDTRLRDSANADSTDRYVFRIHYRASPGDSRGNSSGNFRHAGRTAIGRCPRG
jgi:hypothetical protein